MHESRTDRGDDFNYAGNFSALVVCSRKEAPQNQGFSDSGVFLIQYLPFLGKHNKVMLLPGTRVQVNYVDEIVSIRKILLFF